MISVSSEGAHGNHASRGPSISDDGRHVSFFSIANNLVSNDTNDSSGMRDDIFAHDRDADNNGIFDETCNGCRKTILMSIRSDGTHAIGDTISHSISASGRFVTFSSEANNLVPNDTNDDWNLR